jgi:hypothetical protein
MKKVIFALAIFSSSISYCQFPKAVVNTKVFNFNLTSKIPLNITDPKSLGRKIMNGSITTLYKYSVNNTEHLVLIPSDTIPGPQIHFIKKNNEWTFENYYTQFKMDGARSYSQMDSLGSFVYSSHGDENIQPWPLGDVVVVKTKSDTLTWQKISMDKGHYDNCSSGDLNNDGLIDVITMHMGTNSMRNFNKDFWWGVNSMIPYTQQQDGSFKEDQNIISDPGSNGDKLWPGNHAAGAVLVADVMNDKRPEIILSDYGYNPSYPSMRYSFAIFSYNESIKKYQFIKSQKDLGVFSILSQGATSMKASDFNNDGKLDLAIATEGKLENGKPGGIVQVWLNKGNGDFLPDISIVCEADSNSFREFEVADINNDGWNDIILNGGGGRVARGGGQQGAFINLGPSIWLNNKGKLEPFSELLQINRASLPTYIGGPDMTPVKPFLVNGKFSFIGFQNNCNTIGCNVDTTNNFNLYEATVTFCNNLIKPIFNTTKLSFCSGDSLKLSITNVNKGDTIKWYYGTKSDLTNVSNKTFTDSTKLFVTRKDSLGCVISSDTVQIKKYVIPSAPTLSRDTSNFLLSGATGTTWYKDGSSITDTTQKYKPATPGSYTAKTTTNGCTSVMSAAYYYLVTDIINLSKDEFIKLAPNPFINQLNFDFVVKGYQRLNLEVFDMASGTKVASQPNLTAGTKITLGQLSAGTYVIRVTSTDNKISYQFKMLKL